jgi:hypothetical protein
MNPDIAVTRKILLKLPSKGLTRFQVRGAFEAGAGFCLEDGRRLLLFRGVAIPVRDGILVRFG